MYFAPRFQKRSSKGAEEAEPGSDLPGIGRKLAAGRAWRDVPGKAGKLVLKPLAAVSSAPTKMLAAWSFSGPQVRDWPAVTRTPLPQ